MEALIAGPRRSTMDSGHSGTWVTDIVKGDVVQHGSTAKRSPHKAHHPCAVYQQPAKQGGLWQVAGATDDVCDDPKSML